MAKRFTVGDYLLHRLYELNIRHIFGVPGDYNLGFLDQIEQKRGLDWVGNCNELNAAYAADGYARVKGIAAVVTTFGVGELSAINGIAGSFAELVPVVHIVGMPSSQIRDNQALVHHSLGNGRFDMFVDMFKQVTCEQAILTPDNAMQEIDRVLRACYISKRPVYIGLPSDVSYCEASKPQQTLDLHFPKSEPNSIQEVCQRIHDMLLQANSPAILIDLCAERFPMKQPIQKLIESTGIPFATMNMSKGILDENHPQFMGYYCGDFSTPGVQARIEGADCLISFGALMSDLNTGGFTAHINASVSVEIHSQYTRVQRSRYDDVKFYDLLPALQQALASFHHREQVVNPRLEIPPARAMDAITHDHFWPRMAHVLPDNGIVVAETGTSFFGSTPMPLPPGSTFIGQALWGSIGYSVGALLGATLADPKRPAILFVGDGSFQLTAQEVSTMLRHHAMPYIFLLNNDGYTIERAIHGASSHYNDIQNWDYASFPHSFADSVWSCRVETVGQLEKALQQAVKQKGKLRFVEVVMPTLDCPHTLQLVAKRMSELNRYQVQ